MLAVVKEQRVVRGPASLLSLSTGYRLASLADGEGCFFIGKQTKGKGYVLQFVITMRRDDRPFLEFFQNETGLGSIYNVEAKPHPKCRWVISRKKEVLTLTEIFDEYPPISKKARDYEIWREAVIHWSTMGGTKGNPEDWTPLARAFEELRACRVYEEAA